MVNETQIQLKLRKEEKKLIEQASQILSIGHSTFCRMVALSEARRVLTEAKA